MDMEIGGGHARLAEGEKIQGQSYKTKEGILPKIKVEEELEGEGRQIERTDNIVFFVSYLYFNIMFKFNLN